MYKERIQNILVELSVGLFEREECLKLVLLSMFAGKSIFLYGPPGTAKSMIARRASLAFDTLGNSRIPTENSRIPNENSTENSRIPNKNKGFFAYLMNRFSTPEEIFGSIDIAELKKNNLTRKTDGYLPTAHFAFLDEIWKSSPAILNTLLTIINERIYRDGNTDVKVPLKGIVCASNEFPPANQGLEALYDRMILRYFVKPLNEKENFEKLFKSKQSTEPSVSMSFSADELNTVLKNRENIDFSPQAMSLVHELRSQIDQINANEEYRAEILGEIEDFTPIYVSDRRWKECASLLQTAALLSDRKQVESYDLALLAHALWSDESNKELISKILEIVFSGMDSTADDEINSLKSDSTKLRALIEKDLYTKNGKPKKLESSEKARYLEFCHDLQGRAQNLLDGITSCFNKAKVNIKNPFLSPNDIELALSSFVSPMKEVNNQVLFAAELKDIVENQPVNEKARKQSQAEYKYHPKNNQELKDLVAHESVKLSEIDISKVSDFTRLFQNSTRTDFLGIEDWDVSHVTNMNSMFMNAKNFNADISEWDVSSVTNMSDMFYGATNFNQPLNNWDVSSVTNMSYMFESATSFNQPLENWDVSSVANMSSMFCRATSFNQPLNNWDVSNVTNMEYMFYGNIIFNQPLASWDVSKVENKRDMFYNSGQNPRPSWY
ncbi:BspA family leucine-rich repeat surface protein [Campylobacter sp.]|uniref:BspA family leucine-rich repeat surface protein n=1 Tax=Campylobacter sp. TaxID=205 RepID=UPI002AA8F706|nr:BspA family leucine-rich repeat surface protein [Campylobacter sp.]MCI7076909.1 BspA family leucine-rich repeat surface protein [Campylobacter sp.]